MNKEDKLTMFVLTCHFYGIRSSAGLLQATRQDTADTATRNGYKETVSTILKAYVDDLAASGDSRAELMEIKQKTDVLMTSQGFTIKELGVTGSPPDEAFTKDFDWRHKMEQLHRQKSLSTPEVFIGIRDKGR